MEDIAKKEILEAIGLLADQMQEMRFDMDGMKTEIGGMKTEIGGMKTEIGGMKSDIRQIKATVVTKDYLDDKFADLHSDIVNFVKKRVPCWTESGA